MRNSQPLRGSDFGRSRRVVFRNGQALRGSKYRRARRVNAKPAVEKTAGLLYEGNVANDLCFDNKKRISVF